MNLLNFLGKEKTYSNHTLMNLCASIHISCSPGEVISDGKRDMYCLFYSLSGGAAYKEQGKVFTLPAGSLLLLPCSGGLRLRAMDTGWEAWLFYINGNVLPFYCEALRSCSSRLSLPPASPLLDSLNCLIRLEQTRTLAEELAATEFLTLILSGFLHTGTIPSLVTRTPAYLVKIKEEFDLHYYCRFSLDDLAAVHKISKYRLCREFSRCYGLSPIKYLNQIRIQNACLLLVSGDMHINEIAAAVGIENTNHFIRLFKQQQDMTPMQYRQSVLLRDRGKTLPLKNAPESE